MPECENVIRDVPEKPQVVNSFSELLSKANEKPLNAVVILSGGVKKIITGQAVIAGADITDEAIITSNKTPSIRITSTAFSDADSRNSLGWGKAKDIAAAEIVNEVGKLQPDKPITVITSSRGTNNKSSVSDAHASEITLRQLGIGNEVIRQEKSMDTLTELLEAVRIATENGWQHVAVTTTAYQQPRAEAMMHSILHIDDPDEAKKIAQVLAFNANRFGRDKLPERVMDHGHFKETFAFVKEHRPTLEVSFVSAEDALVHRNPHWYGKVVADAQANPLYDQKMIQDANAADQWRAGDYGKTTIEIIAKWCTGELP